MSLLSHARPNRQPRALIGDGGFAKTGRRGQHGLLFKVRAEATQALVPDREWSGGVAVCLAGARLLGLRTDPRATSVFHLDAWYGSGGMRCSDSRRIRLDRAVRKVIDGRRAMAWRKTIAALPSCPRCGAERRSLSSRFCSRCGLQLQSASGFEAILMLAVTGWMVVVVVRGYRSEGSIARWVWDSGWWTVRLAEIALTAGLWAAMMSCVDRAWRVLENLSEAFKRIWASRPRR